MVEWSIAASRAAGSVGPIVLAAPLGREEEFKAALGFAPASESGSAAGGDGAPSSARGEDDAVVVAGGASRSQSVANALVAVDTELVVVHDAARPLTTPELIDDVVATLVASPDADGAIAATPVADTTKRVEGRVDSSPTDAGVNRPLVVAETLGRDALWAVQTPQAFRVEALRRAIEVAGPGGVESATDDASLIERAGGRVLIHPSSPDNLKVTTPADLRLAELLLEERS